MEPTLINGIPAHALLVHLVVVFVPLTALALVVCAAWPPVMRRFGLALPLLALVTLVSVPLTTGAGEWLEEHIVQNALVARHAVLGDELLPWTVGLFVLTAALWWFYRRAYAAATSFDGGRGSSAGVSVPLRATSVVLCLAVAVGAVVQVYRIGDSGAKATWNNRFSATAGDNRG
ncbi:DUF2231 domain-containing protein [Streptomyces sp. NPDC048496]|uniref:DUF2231 domain-containing protein n=1 Tax=Streptomyces sp. NPDC048496 TaxID=3365558 RepID=UPI0037159CAD